MKPTKHYPKNLSNAELLAIFLPNELGEASPLTLAYRLLKEFGSLKKLLRVKPQYYLFQAAIELGKRYEEESFPVGIKLTNSLQTKRWVTSRLRDCTQEVFACLFLDCQQRVIAFDELFQGTINEVMIYPREVVKRALIYDAANLILAHNHPSGEANPSEADREITQQIKQALSLIDIRLIDHIIVGTQRCFSLAEAGGL